MSAQLTASEREALAQEFISAANEIQTMARKAEDLLLDGGLEHTPQFLQEVDAATNYPDIEEVAVAFRSIAMRLDRLALAKS